MRTEENGPGEMLAALGFTREGVQRQAAYLHGRYGDVAVYARTL